MKTPIFHGKIWIFHFNKFMYKYVFILTAKVARSFRYFVEAGARIFQCPMFSPDDICIPGPSSVGAKWLCYRV